MHFWQFDMQRQLYMSNVLVDSHKKCKHCGYLGLSKLCLLESPDPDWHSIATLTQLSLGAYLFS